MAKRRNVSRGKAAAGKIRAASPATRNRGPAEPVAQSPLAAIQMEPMILRESPSDMPRLWRELHGALPASPLVTNHDPLYALPKELVTLLGTFAADMLGDREKDELLLAQFCEDNDINGFWNRKPFNSVLLLQRTKMRKMLESSTGSPALVVAQQMQAYMGWLVTEPAYLEELSALREAGAAVVAGLRDVHSINFVPRQEDLRNLHLPMTSGTEAFFQRYGEFCRRWCLDRLITWDLPQPMIPTWGVPKDGVIEDLVATGILLYVPYTFISHGTVDLTEIHREMMSRCPVEHLKGWLDKASPSRFGEGEGRFADLFIYHHLWAVIEGRYGDRMSGNRTHVNRAIGQFMVDDNAYADEEGLAMAKKFRAFRNKRLNGIAAQDQR